MRGSRKAWNATRSGLFFFCSFAAAAGCARPNAHAIAAAADSSAHAGIYTWLADHDPSAVLVAGLDAAAVRAVAPDARIIASTGSATDCAHAARARALVAALARSGTAGRTRLEDCGFALYRDDRSLIVAPR